MRSNKIVVVIIICLCFFYGACKCDNSIIDAKNAIIIGETFGLRRTESKVFLYPVKDILSVYSYNNQGNKVYFSKNDYEINLQLNTISRTINSSIPDFADYVVNFNENGSFSFNSEPRNPPLCRQMQIYVDYITSENIINISPSENSFFENKALELPKIAIFGDSIANAAQTTSQYFKGTDTDGFAGLLRDFLKTEYGEDQIIVNNFSQTDSSIDLLLAGKEKVISGGYNTVVIEYGMNDHLSGVEAGAIFETKLQELCNYFLDNGIYIILVGFFQQNSEWDLEKTIYPDATNKYNKIIETVAKNCNVPFVDIFTEFQKISQKKDLIEDMTVDWMHHPTDYGHKFYFSMLLPYFINKKLNQTVL